MKCALCGSTSLVEGKITQTDGGESNFTPSGESLFRRILGMGNRPVLGYGCTHCGNLQLKVEFTESDLERYQSFEGEQPGILERLKDEPQKPEPRRTGKKDKKA